MKTPNHIAFIMDGNRRWAKNHKLEMLFGHDKGAHQIEPLVEYAAKKGISYVTFWAFSTENWKRTKDEVTVLMEVFRRTFRDPMIERLKKNGVRFGVIGNISKFPQDIQDNLKKLITDTKNNKKIIVTIALNYGGREEILRALNVILSEREGSIDSSARPQNDNRITEEAFEKHLYTSSIPDPDLLIRTGGEMRTSGFLPWQTVYTELYFTDVLWPDFDEKEFENALDEYDKRERRFGK